MKGKLVKTEHGWFVRYKETTPLSITTETLPLHPADVEQINKDSQVFDNIEARIASNPEVEFEMVTEYWSGEVGVNGLTYAKLLHHSVDSNEMIDHIGDANKMVEDDDLTDDEWLIKELKKELSTCIVCDEEKQTHVVCMDCIVKTNHEISDEEIEKAKWEHFSDEYADMWSERIAFKLGAKWYREQLKGGQDGC